MADFVVLWNFLYPRVHPVLDDMAAIILAALSVQFRRFLEYKITPETGDKILSADDNVDD